VGGAEKKRGKKKERKKKKKVKIKGSDQNKTEIVLLCLGVEGEREAEVGSDRRRAGPLEGRADDGLEVGLELLGVLEEDLAVGVEGGLERRGGIDGVVGADGEGRVGAAELVRDGGTGGNLVVDAVEVGGREAVNVDLASIGLGSDGKGVVGLAVASSNGVVAEGGSARVVGDLTTEAEALVADDEVSGEGELLVQDVNGGVGVDVLLLVTSTKLGTSTVFTTAIEVSDLKINKDWPIPLGVRLDRDLSVDVEALDNGVANLSLGDELLVGGEGVGEGGA